MTDASKLAKDYDLRNPKEILELLAARAEYFEVLLKEALNIENLSDEGAALLGVILGAQIALEAETQSFERRIKALEAISEQQSAEILDLGRKQ